MACNRSLKVIDLENTLFSKSSHRYLQKCVLCLCWELKTPLDMFRPIFFFEKFPTFCVGVIPSPLLSYGVSTLFPLPLNFSQKKRQIAKRCVNFNFIFLDCFLSLYAYSNTNSVKLSLETQK